VGDLRYTAFKAGRGFGSGLVFLAVGYGLIGMIGALISILTTIVNRIVELLPAGPDLPPGGLSILNDGVAFLKALDPLIASKTELSALLAILTWQITKTGFKGIVWVYDKIRGS